MKRVMRCIFFTFLNLFGFGECQIGFVGAFEVALANGRQDEAAFYARAREALVAQQGNGTSKGAAKSDMPIYNKIANQLGVNNPKSRTAAPTSTAAGGRKMSETQERVLKKAEKVW